jgi:hypothetical protein
VIELSEEERAQEFSDKSVNESIGKAVARLNKDEQDTRKAELGGAGKVAAGIPGEPVKLSREEKRALEAAEAFAAGEEAGQAETSTKSKKKKTISLNIPAPTANFRLPEFGERETFPTANIIGAIPAPVLFPAVQGETPHQGVPILRMKLAQLIALNPFPGGLYTLSQEEETALMPVAGSIVETLRFLKQVSPDIDIRRELQGVELPGDNHDGGIWLEAIEDGMFGDSVRDALYALDSHVPQTADEALHKAAMAEHPIVRAENELGNVLVKEDTSYGDNYETFQSAEDALKAHPEIDIAELDTHYNVGTGFYEFASDSTKKSGISPIEQAQERLAKEEEKAILTQIKGQTKLLKDYNRAVKNAQNAEKHGRA